MISIIFLWNVPVKKLIQLEVLVVLSEGVVERLRHPEPAEDEEEPDRHEYRVVEVDLEI